ncbi:MULTISPECIES: helix-turn-helix domain-containing protein [unclassified Parafrankia]|uniref:helix-turn-helix domain-containing protein n=1 Tax=unclassified Parafrankia TaxID=2994368 RepID=UPI000DA4D834|nr:MULTISPECIES: helix-turn-helix domain-containing protein [unclassified Parafrankia]TCJ34073.1 DNA-binding protein [Parafrankia sp. BMG5.11]SQE00611.1 DNA binding domain protein, excisionase family [Parafrankia sp. Ea1.12]
MTKLLLTVDEAAQLLGLSRAKLYQLMKTGAIASVSIGRLRRIPADELSAYVDRLRGGSVEAA